MKIVFISDTHYTKPDFLYKLELPEGDMIIHSGDYSFQGKFLETELFSKWFNSLDYKYKILVPGNHELELEDEKIRLKHLKLFDNVHILIDKLIEIEGLKIYGFPWQPYFYGWAFNLKEYEMKEKIKEIPDNLDILISHGPSFGILDMNRIGEKCGCKHMYDYIYTKQPKIHCSGHIHEGSGITMVKETLCINASLLNDDYNLVFKPVLVEIDENKNIVSYGNV